MNIKLAIFNHSPESEKLINEFLNSGIQLMADGITYTDHCITFLYREKGVLGSPVHTQLNQINNEIQNSQKRILACLGKIDEINIQLEEHEGTDESKKTLYDAKKIEEKDLNFNKKVIIKLKSMYSAVENGSIDTLNM